MTHAQWYQSLDREKADAIRRLHELEPRWNLIVVAFLLLWVAAAWTLAHSPHLLISIPLYALIGLLISSMANLMHEASHGSVFRHPAKDHWFGFVMGIPLLISVTAYQTSHLHHHKHTRTEHDPDDFDNISSSRPLRTVLFYLWLFLGTFVYLLYLPVMAARYSRQRVRRKLLLEYSLLAAFWAVVWSIALSMGRQAILIHSWLIPLAVTAVWVNLRYWSEHTLTVPGHPLTETRTVTSNRVFSLLNVHMNYHLEHHLFPGVPWYNLPKVHALLRPEFERAGSAIYNSYIVFLFEALRKGPHGKAMGR
jgi:fatty acid desaturase